MIEMAAPQDSRAVQKIWKTCFGDTDSYVRFFVKTHLSRCLVSKEDGRIVSMLFLLPLDCMYHGERRAVQYVYAAATMPLYRRQGLMESLLTRAHDIAVEKGMLFTCLKPASEALYRYYGKLGYQTAFHVTHRIVPRTSDTYPFRLTSADPDAVHEQRLRAFPLGLQWGRELFDFVLREWKLENGTVFAFPGGYCLARKDDHRVLCKEVVSEIYPLSAVANVLCARYGLPEVEFRLPWNGEITPDGGMVRSADGAFDVQEFEAEHPYFNLMLD